MSSSGRCITIASRFFEGFTGGVDLGISRPKEATVSTVDRGGPPVPVGFWRVVITWGWAGGRLGILLAIITPGLDSKTILCPHLLIDKLK